ncbi:hypothetical protein L596_003110 [Steinernema carpocapsae]|uniref:Uncharacterized protein n=1 Tax=Steinernema carpocapsae TaxID=34508 RepID=A0A4U8UR46_STECR|nr:hypothetical protein L596_003110 [Steinernema carpocapsae]
MYGTVHPAAINYTQPRGLSECRTCKSSESSSPHSPKTPKSATFGFSYQLVIFSALKGEEVDYSLRSQIAETIQQSEDQTKLGLIDFITESDGAVALAVENNAWKAFSCQPDDLSSALCDDNVDVLVDLWEKLLNQILPTAVAMLYPLKTIDATFDIRKCILTYFRDRVLLKVLSHYPYRSAALQPMLFAVLLETADNTPNYLNLQRIATAVTSDESGPILVPVRPRDDSVCSSKDSGSSCDSGFSEIFVLENINCARITKARRSEPCTSLLQRRSSLRPSPTKARSRTLPSKSVQWEDLMFDESTVVDV